MYRIKETHELVDKISDWTFDFDAINDRNKDWAIFKNEKQIRYKLFRYQVEELK